jgi:hypothetical protein
MQPHDRLLGVGALALLMLCGCPKAPPTSTFPSAQAALDRMKATHACANGMQAEGKIDHLSEQGRIRTEALLFAVNPARLRFDIVSPFGAMLFSLTSNGETFRMLDLTEKRFLYGPASACNLARLTRVPLEGHVLVSLLRGEAPLLAHHPPDATLDWIDGRYRVVIPSAHQASQTLGLEVYDEDYDKPWAEQRVRVVALRTEQRGRVVYAAELRNHEVARTAPPRVDPDGLDPDLPPSGPACSYEVPRSIRLVVPSTGDDVIVKYDKIWLNPPLPPGAFSQVTPDGVVPELVDCK